MFEDIGSLLSHLYGEAEELNIKLVKTSDIKVLNELVYTLCLIEYWENIHLTLVGRPYSPPWFVWRNSETKVKEFAEISGKQWLNLPNEEMVNWKHSQNQNIFERHLLKLVITSANKKAGGTSMRWPAFLNIGVWFMAEVEKMTDKKAYAIVLVLPTKKSVTYDLVGVSKNLT